MSSSTLYIYTSGALFDSPNSYMYPPISGREFLFDYERDRMSALGDLLKRAGELNLAVRGNLAAALSHYRGTPLSPELQGFAEELPIPLQPVWIEDQCYLNQVLSLGEAETKRLLAAMLATRVQGVTAVNMGYTAVLRQLLRNFEVRRLLFQSYENKLRKGRVIAKDPALYAQLGFLTALELDSTPSLQITNVLLKINDVLVYAQSTLIDQIDCALGAFSIGCELSHIRNLMKTRGVE